MAVRHVPVFGEAQYQQERAYTSAPLEEPFEAISRLVAQGEGQQFGVSMEIPSMEIPGGVMHLSVLHPLTPRSLPAASLPCMQHKGYYITIYVPFSGCRALLTTVAMSLAEEHRSYDIKPITAHLVK